MDSGWVKFHRSMLEWQWYSDKNVRLLWQHLLLIVNYQEKQWRGKTIGVGQIATSLEHLRIGAGLTLQELRTALDKLESTNDITKVSTNGYTLITICKFGFYQGNDGNEQQTDNKPITNEQQTDNKPITTTKEIKKERIEEINSTTTTRTREQDEKFFVKMRQEFTAWQADACRVLKVDQPTLKRYIEEFETECRVSDRIHIDWKDITTHFISWGRIHKEAEVKQKKENQNEKSYDRRRGTEVTAKTADDYKQSF